MKPIIARPTAIHTASSTHTKPSFGQARSEHMQQRLNLALKERRTLAAAQAGAQHASNEPLQTALAARGRMVEHKIDRLHTEIGTVPVQTAVKNNE